MFITILSCYYVKPQHDVISKMVFSGFKEPEKLLVKVIGEKKNKVYLALNMYSDYYCNKSYVLPVVYVVLNILCFSTTYLICRDIGRPI